jgi:hypothetical protein
MSEVQQMMAPPNLATFQLDNRDIEGVHGVNFDYNEETQQWEGDILYAAPDVIQRRFWKERKEEGVNELRCTPRGDIGPPLILRGLEIKSLSYSMGSRSLPGITVRFTAKELIDIPEVGEIDKDASYEIMEKIRRLWQDIEERAENFSELGRATRGQVDLAGIKRGDLIVSVKEDASDVDISIAHQYSILDDIAAVYAQSIEEVYGYRFRVSAYWMSELLEKLREAK